METSAPLNRSHCNTAPIFWPLAASSSAALELPAEGLAPFGAGCRLPAADQTLTAGCCAD
jgi:hypothetical protein